MKYENYKREKEHHAENAMIRAGSWKLLQALARYHYARAKCPKRKSAWAHIAGIRPAKANTARGSKSVDKQTLQNAKRDVSSFARSQGYDVAKIFSKDRSRKVLADRFHCYYFLHCKRVSYKDIGRIMGRDHSTVMYGVQMFQERAA
jgi:Bacterial dnaA protein helix-turn-helix